MFKRCFLLFFVLASLAVCGGYSANECCHPSSVYAFYNALPKGTKKSISTSPRTGHFGTTVNTDGKNRLDAFFREVGVGAVPSEVK